MARRKHPLQKLIERHWGWPLMAWIVVRWSDDDWGWLTIFLSVATIGYFSFSVPVWCMAEGRDGPCRRNANGLLRACSLQQHKAQKGLQILPRSVRQAGSQIRERSRTNPLAVYGAVFSGALLLISSVGTAVSAFVTWADRA